jgi:hypothetical protein
MEAKPETAIGGPQSLVWGIAGHFQKYNRKREEANEQLPGTQ